jgi:CO/xanthine dehydrogenase FAD-binding subunit
MSVLVPTTLDDALRALAADPEAHVLAGGTDLMVEVNFGHRRPRSVVAFDRLPELQGWHRNAATGAIVIGAGVTYAELESSAAAATLPALAQAARTVGSPQIRNAATIGGNLGTCSPAGDGLPVLAALDASVELASLAGRRVVSIHDFMVGVKRTARRPDELIVAVLVPATDGWQGYAKVGTRNAMVIATTSACLVVDRTSRSVRLALGSVGPTVVRARDAEELVAATVDWDTNTLPDPAGTAARFADLARDATRPIDDHRATAAYRRHAVGVLAGRLLTRAFAR